MNRGSPLFRGYLECTSTLHNHTSLCFLLTDVNNKSCRHGSAHVALNGSSALFRGNSLSSSPQAHVHMQFANEGVLPFFRLGPADVAFEWRQFPVPRRLAVLGLRLLELHVFRAQ